MANGKDLKLLNKSEKEALINKKFRTCFNTPDGRFVIEFLVAHSRALANGLKVVSNLKSAYQMSPDYYLGQSDFGKEILSHLTEEQIAIIVASLITTKTEEKNERN